MGRKRCPDRLRRRPVLEPPHGVRILGPLEVRDGERVVELPRQKPRALLACLLLQAGRPVSVDRLIEGLWGESAPATARPSLQNFVSQLRRAIGADASLRPGGYVLDVDPGAVDLVRFERLVERSRRESGRERAETLRLALAMWRGPPLADLAFEPFAPPRSAARGTAHGRPGGSDRRGARARAAPERDLVRGSRRSSRAPAPGAPPRPAHARALPQRPPGRGARRLPGPARRASSTSSGSSRARTARARAGDPPAGAGAGARDATSRPVRREAWMLATVLLAELTVCEAPPGLDPEALRGSAPASLAELRAATKYHGGTVRRASGDDLLAVFTGHEDERCARPASALQMKRATRGPPPEERALPRRVRAAVTTGSLILTGAGPPCRRPTSMRWRSPAGSPRRRPRARSGSTRRPRRRRMRAHGGGSSRHSGDEAGRSTRSACSTPSRARSRARAAPPRLIGRERRAGPAPAGIRGGRRPSAAAASSWSPARPGSASRAWLPSSQQRWARPGRVSPAAACRTARARPISRCARSSSRWSARIRGRRSSSGSRVTSREPGRRGGRRVSWTTPAGNGGSSTGESFWAVRRFLETLAEERPLVLVFDDLHWARAHLPRPRRVPGARSRSLPVLVVVLTRPDLFEAAAGHRGRDSIALSGLGDEDVRRLVDGRSPATCRRSSAGQDRGAG